MAPNNLMQQGVELMLKQICNELQGNTDEQLRALRTLANMSRRSASAVSVTAVQKGFRELGAFEPLTKLMWDMLPDHSATPQFAALALNHASTYPDTTSISSQRRAIFNASLECCTELVTRCPPNCAIAVKQGIIALATSYISSHINPPPNPAALRLLYQLVLCKEHAADVYEAMMSCLTIPALTHLLDAALMHAGPHDRGAWATEILEVLAPLVINCQEAAEQLVTLGGLQALSALVHHPAEEPLPLSLMLDMVEALVALGDDCVQAEVRQMLVRDGLLQPVLQALRLPGLNRKSVAILSHMAKEPATVEIMQAIISPRTLHELCRVALDTAEAADLDAGITLMLLATLLSPGSLLSLRNLILGRCVNLALALPRVAPQVVAVSTTAAGQAVLDNLGAEHALDCALAAAHLFVACSDASMLTKQHRLAILAAAALREARDRCSVSAAHSVQAVAATVGHLQSMRAADPDAPAFAPFLSSASREGSVVSVAPDILRRMSSSADTAYGQRTPEYSHTPSAHSPATAAWAANGAFPVGTPTSPIFHQWRSVDEMRAESAGDCRFSDGPSAGPVLATPPVEPVRPVPAAPRTDQRLGSRKATPLTTLAEESHGYGSSEAEIFANGAAPSSNGRTAGSGHQQPKPPITKSDVNKKRYDTVTFLIGDREFYALGWALEQCCPQLRSMLESVDSLSDPLTLLPVDGISDAQLYKCFALLVEYAYTGTTEVPSELCSSVWALAASLGFAALKDHCQQTLMREPDLWSVSSGHLGTLIMWTARFDPDGDLHVAACHAMIMSLEEALTGGVLAVVAEAEDCSALVVAGMYVCLDRLLKSAMESGVLANAAGISVFPAGI
eukprot:jgi/Ulvmu1/10210/UM060_0010.1